MRNSVVLACLVFGVSMSGVAGAAGPLPSLPGQAGEGSAPAPAAAPAGNADAPLSVIERVRKGIVMLERDGRLVGFGTVLGGDGRILTALSAVGGDAVNVRYADGTSIPAKVGHRDKSWDLALLIPQSGKWKDGLTASEADPSAVELRAPIPLKIGSKPIALPVRFKGKMDALSKEGEALANALEVELHHNLPIAGAPLLDGAGTVVAVIVHACKLSLPTAPAAKDAKAACTPMLVGAPVSAIRSFLINTPSNAVQPPPWLGIVGQPDASGPMHGVRVMAVAPSSPAEKGGLKSSPERDRSDLIVAVDGQPIDSPEKLADVIAKKGVGDTVKLLVLGGAATAQETPSFREVAVVLRAAP